MCPTLWCDEIPETSPSQRAGPLATLLRAWRSLGAGFN
jgi:hypothetical protein